ncbi:haloacid dehalogenase type II [Aquimarina algicola]|uniref:Haloacid dehalogenase type II n=1 Tax=Aquimarina algicola TaxID=2589995 RepID=A0A504JJL0_9FLAO|nr:haloacid dehalogenase type II [Aquimarina algicola]TPN86949.1 haloacid dehalogenase type II [Aquimarina algicola]
MQITKPKVLFFDVNETLLDLTTMKKSVGTALGGREELLPLWFTTMLQHSLVATVSNHFEDFGAIGVATLQMIAANHGISLSDTEAKQAIIDPLLSLPPHPEVKTALELLKKEGYTLAAITNSSHKGVQTQFKNAGLTSYFDAILSVEHVGKYKPHPDTYNWGVQQMKVLPSEAMLIAAHGWDIAGALWAGWRAAFVSRPGAQLYPLAPKPETIGNDLKNITTYLSQLK